LAAPSALAADEVKAISTPGDGNLTNCSYSGCNLYHHIKMPAHIAVGDKVRVRFGSNPKQYDFRVARILREADTCGVFSQLTETQNVDKIEITPCQVLPDPQ
jgi:hypothetical protein